MDLQKISHIISGGDTLSETLGIEFISTPDPETCMARMRVDRRNMQPFGFLSGGASLAMAENLAGVASLALCPNRIPVGINVTGAHLKAVEEGDKVTATALLLHKGNTLHRWQIQIKNSGGDLISDVQVTNYILKNTKQNE